MNKQWEKCYKAFLSHRCVKKTKTRLADVRVKNSLSAELDVVVRMSESATASPCAAQAIERRSRSNVSRKGSVVVVEKKKIIITTYDIIINKLIKKNVVVIIE